MSWQAALDYRRRAKTDPLVSKVVFEDVYGFRQHTWTRPEA
jgi:hypothetical protein